MKLKMIVFTIAFILLHGNTLAQAEGGAYSRLGSGEAATSPLKTEAGGTYQLSSLPQERYQAVSGPADYQFDPPFQAYALRQDSQARQNVNVAEGWDIQTPDPDVDTGAAGNSIAVDAQGWPRISYEWTRDFGRYLIDLRYATWDGIHWNIQTVHNSAFGTVPAGYRSSLALDSQGKPHITYHREEISGFRPTFLMHATTNPYGVWVEETVDEFTFGDFFDSSVAVDPSTNRVSAMYTSRTDGFSGLRWVTVGFDSVLIEPGYFHITHNSLAFDSVGRSHIVYHAFTEDGDALKYRGRFSGDRVTTVIEQNLGTFGESAIALDSQGRPRIAYVNPNEDQVKYAAWNGAAWDIEVVSTDYGLNKSWYRSDISLVIGPGGTPHILYWGGWALKYAMKNNGSWKTFIVHPGPVGFHSDLALDTAGRLHASFFDWEDRRLKYARSRFLVNPSFRVTAPRAGDTWVTGSTYTIAWQTENIEDAWVGAVRLWWDTLPVAEIRPPYQQSPASGSIQWQVPEDIPPGDYYLVEAILNRGVPGSHTQITDAWAGPFYVRRP